jgi:orotate phosphoribosyltransferase-like protein
MGRVRSVVGGWGLVLEEARAVDAAPREEWAFRAASLGESVETLTSRAEVLTEWAKQIADLADELNCQAVVGASAVGDRLAAAAVATAGNGLALYSAGSANRVLVVDSVLATGAQVVRSIRTLQEQGATYTPAVVVIALDGAERFVSSEVGEVRLLQLAM